MRYIVQSHRIQQIQTIIHQPITTQSVQHIYSEQTYMEDQQLCKFWFKITPTKITNLHTHKPLHSHINQTNTHNSNTNQHTASNNAQTSSTNINNKSILIKLGNKQSKCKCIGQPVEIVTDVLYSKTLNKYCPIKGIIKIYDINAKDQSQVISCVGAFNTEDLLAPNMNTNTNADKGTDSLDKVIKIQRDIGAYRVQMTVEIKKIKEQDQDSTQINTAITNNNKNNENVDHKINLGSGIMNNSNNGIDQSSKDKYKTQHKNQQQNINALKIPIKDTGLRSNIVKNISSNTSLRGLEHKFVKSPRLIQNDFQDATPYIMDDSCDYQDISRSRLSDASDQTKKEPGNSEKEALGQQLIEERRKNKGLQDKIEKNNVKIQLLKKNLTMKNNQLKNYYMNFKNFAAALECDTRGQYICQMNQKKRQISLRYKANIKFKQIFQDFILFMIKKITENNTYFSNDRATEDEESEINKVIARLQSFDEEKRKIYEQNNYLTAQIALIQNEISKKNVQIIAKDALLVKKIEQHTFLEEKFKNILDEKKGLQGLNQYLQERDTQMEQIINTKQGSIENLRRLVQQNNLELDSLEDKNSKLVKIVQNLQLQVQQMKQQNANLSETIQNYRENYGDLKTAKDRALEREFKECLRWIDQQNHDEQLNLEDTTLEDSDPPTTVNTIIRSIGEIENMPLEEISLIRKEVIGVLKRLDQFVAKNSLAGMSP